MINVFNAAFQVYPEALYRVLMEFYTTMLAYSLVGEHFVQTSVTAVLIRDDGRTVCAIGFKQYPKHCVLINFNYHCQAKN